MMYLQCSIFDETGKSREVLLDCLLDHQKKMKEPYTISDAEIRQEIDAFVFAVHKIHFG
jgi:hypothetical protein